MMKDVAASGKPITILGTGSFLPDGRKTNGQLAQRFGVTSEWIFRRTGIHERRIASPGIAASQLGLEAAQAAISAAGIDSEDIDLIVVATSTPDTVIPSTACRLQQSLGARPVPAFDLSAACSGFLYAVSMAHAHLSSTNAHYALVVGTEVRSRFTDPDDRDTSILYGDGAGAVVLGSCLRPGQGIMDIELGADGSGSDLIEIPGGGSLHPASLDTVKNHLHYVRFRKHPLMKKALRTMQNLINGTLERNGIGIKDISLIIPHQMNGRILEMLAARLELPDNKMFINLDQYGNTSAASIPIAIDEALHRNRITRGDLVLLVGFGAGLTWGSVLFNW